VTDSKKEEDKQREVSSWRTGLRKTGSTSAVLENNKDEADKNLSRSLSSPRIPVERNSVNNVSERFFFKYLGKIFWVRIALVGRSAN
jgi:hypothetical protein